MTDSQTHLKLLILGSFILTANSQVFRKHQTRKILSTLAEKQADSAIYCCYQCTIVDTCKSVSYDSETGTCLLSEVKDTEIIENTDIDNGWTTFSMGM